MVVIFMPIPTAFIYNKSKEYGAHHGTHSDIYSHTLKAINTPGDKMRYTWANDNETWFGFWHFEIVSTIAYLLKNQSGIPDGIDPILMRKRMVETVTWINNNVR